jgi:hypothetical protein
MDYVLLCISWEDLGDSAKLSTFNDLTSKLLPVAATERQLMGDSPKWAWFIANTYELHANGVVRYVEDGCRAFHLQSSYVCSLRLASTAAKLCCRA